MAKTKNEVDEETIKRWVKDAVDYQFEGLSLDEINKETFEGIILNVNSHDFDITMWSDNCQELERIYDSGTIVKTVYNQYNNITSITLDGKIPEHIKKRTKIFNYRESDFAFVGVQYK